jgi:hypothetical protein
MCKRNRELNKQAMALLEKKEETKDTPTAGQDLAKD